MPPFSESAAQCHHPGLLRCPMIPPAPAFVASRSFSDLLQILFADRAQQRGRRHDTIALGGDQRGPTFHLAKSNLPAVGSATQLQAYVPHITRLRRN